MQYPKQKQTQRKYNKAIVARLDAKFRVLIRLRDGLKCRRCGRQYEMKDGKIPAGLQCAHIKSRRYHNTRWLEVNALALCGGCHIHFTGNPNEFIKWLISSGTHTQESLDWLDHVAQPPYRGDLVLLEIYLDQELGKLK